MAALAAWVRLLPRAAVLLLAPGWGRWPTCCCGADRRVALANLDIVLPDTVSRSEKRADRPGDLSPARRGRARVVLGPRMTRRRIDGLLDAEETLTVLRHLESRGKGVIVATAYYGDWEQACHAMGLLGLPLLIVTEPMRNKRIEAMFSGSAHPAQPGRSAEIRGASSCSSPSAGGPRRDDGGRERPTGARAGYGSTSSGSRSSTAAPWPNWPGGPGLRSASSPPNPSPAAARASSTAPRLNSRRRGTTPATCRRSANRSSTAAGTSSARTRGRGSGPTALEAIADAGGGGVSVLFEVFGDRVDRGVGGLFPLSRYPGRRERIRRLPASGLG